MFCRNLLPVKAFFEAKKGERTKKDVNDMNINSVVELHVPGTC